MSQQHYDVLPSLRGVSRLGQTAQGVSRGEIGAAWYGGLSASRWRSTSGGAVAHETLAVLTRRPAGES